MAFLAPAAATTAGTSLAAGVTTGLTLGKGVGLVASPSLLAPTLGATLPTGSLLTGAGGSLLGGGGGSLLAGGAGLGGAGGLLGGSAALLPKFASLGGAGGSLLAPAAGGLGGALTPTGLASLQMPAGSLLKGGATLAGPSPASWSAVNQATGLGDLGFKSAQLPSNFIKTADVATKTGVDTSLLGQGAKFKDVPSLSRTDLLAKQAGQVPKTLEAASLAEQAQVGQRLSDAARAQKMAEAYGYASPIQPGENFLSNLGNLIQNPSMQGAKDYVKEHPYATAGAAYGLYSLMQPKPKQPEVDKGMIRPYTFDYNPNVAAYSTSPTADSKEQVYFNPMFTAQEPIKAADGGIVALAVGGPVEQMAAMNSVGANTQYPMAGLATPLYSNPAVQRPEAVNVVSPSAEPAVGAYSGEQKFAEGGEPKTEGEYKYDFDPKTNTFTQLSAPRYADTTAKNLPAMYTGAKTSGGIAAPVGGLGIAALMPQAQTPYAGPVIPAYQTPEERLGLGDFYVMMNRRLGAMGGYAAGGGISDLGGYSDGGRLLRGPGDGVSDSIPAVIGDKQPARLADGEFVIPARIVSELGNGSTEAGARKLYAMMDRVQKSRSKTVGKDRVAANTRADKHLPA